MSTKVFIANLSNNTFIENEYQPEGNGIIHLVTEDDLMTKVTREAGIALYNAQLDEADPDRLPADATAETVWNTIYAMLEANPKSAVKVPGAEVRGPKAKGASARAAKKEAKPATQKKASSTRARPVYDGLKLEKTGTFKGHPNSARSAAYNAVKNGMLFDTFRANGGVIADLTNLIRAGHIKAS